MSQPIAVALAADRNFCKQLAVAIASISRVASSQPYTAYVLHDGYDPAQRARVAHSAGTNVEVIWIEVDPRTTARARLTGAFPPASLYRLHLATLLPTSLERVIYLDADSIVRRTLAPLWATDVGEDLVGAVRDAILCWAALGLPWRQFEMHPGLPYFNAGVLLIPLARWRESKVSEQALELTTRHTLEHLDQSALNVLLPGRWRALEPRWNVQSHHLVGDKTNARAVEDPEQLDAALRDPAIVHLCNGPWKRPWQPESRHPYRDEWLEILDTTAWAGWRPDEPTAFTKRMRAARRSVGRLLP